MKNLFPFSQILFLNLLLFGSIMSFAQTDPPENLFVTPIGAASWDSITSNDFQFYKVFLNGVFITDTDSIGYQYGNNGEELISGESYSAEISALYNDGLSEKVSFEFIYFPCDSFPNYQLMDAYNMAGTDDVLVSWTDNVTFTPIYEDFESGILPEGWSMLTNSSIGWFITNDGSSTYWEIPEGDGFYACSNDDAANDDGSMDYLITPEMHFVGLSEINLSFSSFLSGEYGESGTVEISLDGGNSWIVVEEVEANDDWMEIQVDLSAFTGESSIEIAFHANDHGEWSSGWAIDNVSVTASKYGKANSIVIGTNVYLDNTLLAFVPEPDTFYLIQDYSFYGYHDICVDKVYTNDNGVHTWTSCFGDLCIHDIGTDWPCLSPENLYLSEWYYNNLYCVDLYWDMPEGNIQEILGFYIFRDNIQINTDLVQNLSYRDTVDNSAPFCYEIYAIYPECWSEASNEACGMFEGLNEYEIFAEIYPNPTQNQCKIASETPISSLRIYNQLGQICKSIEQINALDYQLNLSDLENGIYIIEVESKTRIQKTKLIIEK